MAQSKKSQPAKTSKGEPCKHSHSNSKSSHITSSNKVEPNARKYPLEKMSGFAITSLFHFDYSYLYN